MLNPENINWEKVNGLVPAIIQDHRTHQVLMMGYMNREALARTCETGQVTFYSRTKERLWMKGETSGYVLNVVRILEDCDHDTLLIFVNIEGPCCHLNRPSCFGADSAPSDVLARLEQMIRSRYRDRPEGSYTTRLFEEGMKHMAQKVGEEGVEVALAAVAGDREEVISEVADLLYHTLVLMTAKAVSLEDVCAVLSDRLAAYEDPISSSRIGCG